MGMANGVGTGRTVSEINVTPLIDVLLVLLIIFMVIVPVTPKGLGALIPQPPAKADVSPSSTIVVSVVANAKGELRYLINRDLTAKATIEPKLAEIFATRQEKTMFVKADESIEFSRVAELIDMGHQAQVDNIGLIKADAAR
jgi:biopolymer transport protein TolR